MNTKRAIEIEAGDRLVADDGTIITVTERTRGFVTFEDGKRAVGIMHRPRVGNSDWAQVHPEAELELA